jgi:hypothetical protein
MTFGVIVDVPAPAEMYDAMHAVLLERAGGSVQGLLVHLARETDNGFQIIEVWESEEDYARGMAEIVAPIMREMAGDAPAPEPEQQTRPFAVRGLVLPSARIAV